MVGGDTLNGKRYDFSCGFFSFFLGFLLEINDLDSLFMCQLTVEIIKDIGFCLFCCEAGYFFENFKFTLFDFFGFCKTFFCPFELLVHGFIFFLKAVELLFSRFFFLLDTSFLTLHFLSSVGDLTFGIVKKSVSFFLACEDGFLFGCLCGTLCFFHDSFCLQFGGAYFIFADFFTVLDSRKKCTSPDDHGYQYDQEYCQYRIHFLFAPPVKFFLGFTKFVHIYCRSSMKNQLMKVSLSIFIQFFFYILKKIFF